MRRCPAPVCSRRRPRVRSAGAAETYYVLLGLENERGAIRSGMKADNIATTNNPLDNIDTLKAVNFVMKDGKVFKSNTSLP
jgi:hypothetical protein